MTLLRLAKCSFVITTTTIIIIIIIIIIYRERHSDTW